MNRVNIVTLGVSDLNKSKAFFADLFGWKPTKQESDDIAFFDMGGWLLALYPRDLLSKDAKVRDKGGSYSGITLAHNVRGRGDVAIKLKRAEKLGAKIIKPAQEAFWGGYSGYFRDLDGHYWEVAWNPFLSIRADGTLALPPAE